MAERSRDPALRSPVEARAIINGPEVLSIARARENGFPRRREYYKIKENEKFDKEFLSPQKLTLNAYTKAGGNIEISSSGRKVWTRANGPEDIGGTVQSYSPEL